MNHRTKIVATIGPATASEEVVRQLLITGVNVARLNMSHGTHEDHASVFYRLRNEATKLGRSICILLDLQGPKLRIGNLPDGSRELKKGQVVRLTTGKYSANLGEIPVDYPELLHSIHPGGRILLDDGSIELKIDSIESTHATAHVIYGGILKSLKGINLKDAHLDIRSLTEKDEIDLEFGLKLGVDCVALSFVRNIDDIAYLRKKIRMISPEYETVPIIVKVERHEALEHLDEIIEFSDGVMVARGDLGVDISLQEVPIAQKMIIECANRNGKVVITATQMLESMITNPRPTRAEASDIANAIFDGTDAVMLSAETAIGEYPIKAVEMMAAIINQAEQHLKTWGNWQGPVVTDIQGDDTRFMSLAVRELAQNRNVAAIAVFTMSGKTALHVSKTRPGIPILAFTPNISTYNLLELYWGVQPFLVNKLNTIEEMLEMMDEVIYSYGVVPAGSQIAITCGFPLATISPTNLVLLHTIAV